MCSKDLISVVIPLYNSKDNIDNLIKMLEEQTIKNFEIILVNDGSTDGTKEKLEELKNEKNIYIYNKTNGGPSSSRNLGISKANGEFIVFIDDDDLIEKCYLEKLYTNIKKSDFVVAAYKTKQGNNVKISRPTQNKQEILEKQEFIKRFAHLKDSYIYHPLWNKIYKKHIIIENNIKFDENKTIGEDFLFNIDYIKYVNKICLIEDIIYNYIIADSNSLTQKYRENLWEEEVQAYEYYKKYFINIKVYEKYSKEIEAFLIHSFNTVISHLFNSRKLQKNEIKKKIQEILKNEDLQKSVQIAQSYNLYIKIIKTFIKIKNVNLIYFTYKIKYTLKNILRKELC